MRKTAALVASFILAFSAAFASPPEGSSVAGDETIQASDEQLALMAEQFQSLWKESGGLQDIQVFRYGVVDWKGASVTTKGKAPLLSSSPSDQMLAKRAALSDARRNLLCLLYEIRYGLPENYTSIEVEGEVVDGHVDFQGVADGLFTVELTTSLERFFSETKILRSRVR